MQLLDKIKKNSVVVLSIIFVIFQILTTSGLVIIDTVIQRSFHLAFVAAITFLSIPLIKSENSLSKYIDIILAVIAISTGIYFYVNLDYCLTRIPYVDELQSADIIFGIITICVVLEITRRTSGKALVIISVISLAYAYFGPYLPGKLHHSGIDLNGLIEHIFLLPDGIYGIPLSNAATIIFAFILFGAFLEKCHMNDLFMDLACLATRNAKGGPAKAAIFASALFGSISGSAVANVYGTGIFTIPTMKRVGYIPKFAGAVEAVASTGGQIMPPVMGAAAFIMADITGLGYLAVAKAALFPAILYYLSLFFMIHFQAVKHNIGSTPKDMVPSISSIISRLYYLTSLILLIVLIVMGYSPIYSALSASLLIYILSWFSPKNRMGLKGIIETFIFAAKNTLMVTSCCACAGIIIGVITITGAGFSFINMVASLAGDNIVIMLIMLMSVCIIMGMGVPTAPAYILVASLGAPLLIKAGVPMIAAHMFLLYYAVISVITPPVCLASFAGAAIAEAPAMQTGIEGCKLATVSFIIPFMFVFEPALLLIGDTSTIIMSIITSLVGVISVSAAMQGFLLRPLNKIEQLLLLLGGFFMIYPGFITDICGCVTIVSILLIQIYANRRKATM
ncbi:TRAP transporter fused permease subunit [uncultured Mailhella sp.]|uniref:TRAP transporter permease n=1 Tax=uncultured Mailhella sp. TaxID=1981031 RepID=UPI0025DA818B|nr:TRAP transporter fused permease subunit [uncultured Mailhella sp.]